MKQILFWFLFLLMVFESCTYECDVVSKVDLDKPAPWHSMNIELTNQKDSILIFGPTDFTFSAEALGLNFNGAVVRYLDNESQFASSNQTFKLNPTTESGSWFDLTIECYYSTGTGSIADRLGAENYVGKRNWKVKFVNLASFDYRFSSHVNAQGLVELYYVKPEGTGLTNGVVSFYGNKIPCSKLHGDTVFFTDSLYYGGPRDYYLSLKYSENGYVGGYAKVDYPLPQLTFTNVSLDSCLISWTATPVRLRYVLTCDDKLKYQGRDNRFMDVQPRPGQRCFYRLTSSCEKTTNSMLWSESTSTYHVLGTTSIYKTTYSPAIGKFVVSRRRNFPNLEKFSVLPEDDSNGYYGSWYELYTNPSGTIIVGKSWGTLSVFDENLQLKKTLTIPNDAEQIQVSDNGRVGYFYNKQYTLLNVGSDPTWSSFSFRPHYDDSVTVYTRVFLGAINLSADGNYVFCRAAYDFYLYDVTDHQNAKLLRTVSRDTVSRVCANPLNVNEMVVQGRGLFEIRSCPDYRLIRTFDANYLNGCVFCNIDPVSGLMLGCTATHYVLIDINRMKEVFRLKPPVGYEYSARLYNRHLIVGSSSLDLSTYLN